MWRAHFLHFHHGSSGRSSSSICIVSCTEQGQQWHSQSMKNLKVHISETICKGRLVVLVQYEFILSPYRRHISIHYCLQDLHPFCQVLSVDEFQGKVVLWRWTRKSLNLTTITPGIQICSCQKCGIIDLRIKYRFQWTNQTYFQNWLSTTLRVKCFASFENVIERLLWSCSCLKKLKRRC